MSGWTVAFDIRFPASRRRASTMAPEGTISPSGRRRPSGATAAARPSRRRCRSACTERRGCRPGDGPEPAGCIAGSAASRWTSWDLDCIYPASTCSARWPSPRVRDVFCVLASSRLEPDCGTSVSAASRKVHILIDFYLGARSRRETISKDCPVSVVSSSARSLARLLHDLGFRVALRACRDTGVTVPALVRSRVAAHGLRHPSRRACRRSPPALAIDRRCRWRMHRGSRR